MDWGTTRLRLRLLSGAPGRRGVLGERVSDEGIAVARDHAAVFLRSLKGLLEPLDRWDDWRSRGGEVYFSGMITSTLGWFETPYLPLPAGARELLRGRRTERLGNLRLHFLPGLRSGDDVLRGEEVEAIGILDRPGVRNARALLVLPGTHSKWLRWESGRITGFKTIATGDLHAGLHRATLLARTLPRAPAAVEGPRLLAAFDRGVALARRDGPLTSLFKARSLSVLERLAPEPASALLSGILIAGEVLERAGEARRLSIRVAGARPLRRLYLRAFRKLGVPADEVPEALAARASAEGLRVLRALAGEA